jgi:DNA-binding transcriptional MerR regulator
MERTLSIGRLSQETGCKVETIRFYEGIGLLPEPERTEGNQRRYVSLHVDRCALSCTRAISDCRLTQSASCCG